MKSLVQWSSTCDYTIMSVTNVRRCRFNKKGNKAYIVKNQRFLLWNPFMTVCEKSDDDPIPSFLVCDRDCRPDDKPDRLTDPTLEMDILLLEHWLSLAERKTTWLNEILFRYDELIASLWLDVVPPETARAKLVRVLLVGRFFCNASAKLPPLLKILYANVLLALFWFLLEVDSKPGIELLDTCEDWLRFRVNPFFKKNKGNQN